jgi:peptide/nickel transport system substrate-binding protein
MPGGHLTRREALKGGLTAGAALVLPAGLAGCFGGGGGADKTTSSTAARGPTGTPKPGGRLRIAMIGGGGTETLDPNAAVPNIDSARATCLFNRLTRLKPDLSLELELAESFEPNKNATQWTLRLRDGVEWHDGSPLVADDVLYTLQRMGAKDSTLFGKNVTNLIDLGKVSKLDDRTLRLPLKSASASFPELFQAPQMMIVKDGETDFNKNPIGTGPFMFASFTPGQNSLFKKNPNYWESGLPYVDELVITSTPDPTARLNALLAGQVDAMEQLSFEQAKTQKSAGRIRVLEATGSSMVPIYMATTLDPFKDARVRQAMRLIADRDALLATVQLGLGAVGNDHYGRGFANYNDQLPQRKQDIEQAKSLLKSAGQSDLRVTLFSSSAGPGMLESATVFAEQAKAAGVTVKVDNGPADTYFGPKYLKQNFAQTQWPTFSIYSWYQQAMAPSAPFNETHWADPRWNSVLKQAEATVDDAKRKELYFELAKIEYDSGGYLIWGFYPLFDGLAKNVGGAVPSAANELSNFKFSGWWLA